jgi:hypothetical protein
VKDRQQEILDESGYNDLTTNTDNVNNCAMLLVLGYIREATTCANLVAEASLLILVGDVTRMKLMNIGGGTA